MLKVPVYTKQKKTPTTMIKDPKLTKKPLAQSPVKKEEERKAKEKTEQPEQSTITQPEQSEQSATQATEVQEKPTQKQSATPSLSPTQLEV